MKSIFVKFATIISLFCICALANGQSGYREIFSCTLNDGKTMDEVKANNARWVVFMNENVAGGGIGSSVLTSIVGNASVGHFIFLDFFPSLESWAAAKQAVEGNAEGEAIMAELLGISDCSENRVYRAEEV